MPGVWTLRELVLKSCRNEEPGPIGDSGFGLVGYEGLTAIRIQG